MELALLRHGVAEHAGPATDYRDEPRALTRQGADRVRRGAEGIAHLGLRPDLLATSPLVRCAQTADIVAAALGVEPVHDDRLRPGMDLDGVADLLAEHPDAASVMLCGHQPGLSLLVADLIGGGSVEFKKGGLAVLSVMALRRNGAALLALHPPRALRRLAASAETTRR